MGLHLHWIAVAERFDCSDTLAVRDLGYAL